MPRKGPELLRDKIQDLTPARIQSIRVTMGLVLAAVMLLGGLSAGASLWVIRAQRHDALVINLAGRQGMLSQRTAKEAWLGLRKGQDPHYLDEMHNTAHQFQEGLRALMEGGQVTYAGRVVSVPPAIDPTFRAALQEVQATWEPLHQAAHVVLEEEPGSPEFAQGATELERLSDEILERMDRAVRVYQAAAEARVNLVRWIQLASLIAGPAVTVLGGALILVHVLRPVELLEAAAGRMEEGNLDRPVQVETRNEVGRLAQAFNGMRAQIRARIEEQAVLLDLSHRLLGLMEPQAIAQVALEVVDEHLQPDAISLLAPDEDGTHLELIAAQGWTEERVGHRLPLEPPGSSCAAWALHTGESVFWDHTRPDQPFAVPEAMRQAGVQTCLAIPMLARGGTTGVLVLDSLARRTFSADEVRFLSLMANQTAIALQRAREQQAVREAQARYWGLFDGVPVGLYRTSPEGEMLDANPALVEMLGYPDRGTLLGVNAADVYVDPEDRARWKAAMEQEGVLQGFEIQFRRRDGTVIWVRDSARTVRDDEGRVLYYQGSVEDITEHKEAEQALRESEEKYRTIVENIEDGYYEVDIAGNFTGFNDSLCRILGYSKDELMGMNNREYMDAENAEKVYQTFNAVYRTGKPTRAFDWEIIRKDGTRRLVEASVSLITDATGEPAGFRGIVRDVTERREMEEQLQRQERMAAVGQLAGGIAHDFNNFLSTITLYSQFLLRKPDLCLAAEQVSALETIVDEAQQASQLVEQILDFSRRSAMETEPVDLVPFTREVIEILHQAIPENVQVIVEAPPSGCIVKADPTRIQQALMNLALNARDAMPDGGELRIDLSRVEVTSREKPPVADMPPGRWVCLAVSDTGTGMTEEVQSHLFEPFFTTKEPGKGTGLGLAQVFGIVKQHRGYLDVESQVDRGTTVTIYLPINEEEKPREEGTDAGEVLQGKGETILLVEDEARVREAGREVLQSLGYRVLTAANGREGLEIYRSAKSVDLVLTDLVMPEMGGQELIGALREEDPQQKALVMTGYVAAEALRDLKNKLALDVVHKPFDVDSLAQAVRHTLDGQDGEDGTSP